MLMLMDTFVLPPDPKLFANEAVASERYRDVAELVRAGVALPRRTEADDLRRARHEGVDGIRALV